MHTLSSYRITSTLFPNKTIDRPLNRELSDKQLNEHHIIVNRGQALYWQGAPILNQHQNKSISITSYNSRAFSPITWLLNS